MSFAFRCMNFTMLTSAHYLKIFKSIVVFYFVNMMNYCPFENTTSMIRLINQYMFQNISMIICKSMSFANSIKITTMIPLPTFPSMSIIITVMTIKKFIRFTFIELSLLATSAFTNPFILYNNTLCCHLAYDQNSVRALKLLRYPVLAEVE